MILWYEEINHISGFNDHLLLICQLDEKCL